MLKARDSKILIIGSGQIGLALTGWLLNKHISVKVLSVSFILNSIKKEYKNNIEITGVFESVINREIIDSDSIYSMIFEATTIIFCVPTYLHYSLFNEILKFLKKEHKIIFLTGNFTSSKIYLEYQNSIPFLLGETCSSPFIARHLNHNQVKVYAIKNKLRISSDNIYNSQTITEDIIKIFPSKLILGNGLLWPAMHNINGIFHPIISIFNIARIEKGEKFYFYKDGTSKFICKLAQQIDLEREKIMKKLGFNPLSSIDIFFSYYNEKFDKLNNIFLHSKTLNQDYFCPSGTNGRYFLEDIFILLDAWLKIAKDTEVATPYLEKFLQLSKAALL